MFLRPLFVLLSFVYALACPAEDLPSRQGVDVTAASSVYCVTNVAKFRNVSGADFLAGCDFRLTGVITLVDTNRDLMVLQDATGAVALNFCLADQQLQVGQLVSLEGSNCCPLLASFPDYPYHPAGMDIRTSFETPTDWGEYNLTRMRGFLRPKATGEYRFWIASDNSSELWLSTDTNPSNIRKIASIPRFGYVSPHEWTRYPSQASDPIVLKAGELYYIEALQEQTTVGENLSVAWQGPGLGRAVIERGYLIPWDEATRRENPATNGILREFWIHYPAGEIEGISGPRPFESALTVKSVRVKVLGEGNLPKPISIDPSQPLSPENSFRWVRVEGILKFKASDENTACLELLDGHTIIQVRALCGGQEMSKQLTNAFVQVEGVCEGVRDEKENTMPWLIWCPTTNCISFNESDLTNPVVLPSDQYPALNVKNSPAVQGFFSTRGVVTFNHRVFGKDYISVQGDNSAVLVSTTNQSLAGQLQVGKNVELGGALDPGKNLPIITPLVVSQVGWRSMPLPIVQQPGVPFSPNSEGMWTELEGVAHSVNPNGTLSVIGRNGPVYFWIGDTSSNVLAHKLDARLRARGVLMLSLLDAPLLLIPNQSFVDMEEDAPQNPFQIDRSSIASLFSAGTDQASGHRVHIEGRVTYRDVDSFFVEDDSGGIRVQASGASSASEGEMVELAAFPTKVGPSLTLTQPILRLAKSNQLIAASNLELGDALVARQKGTLIQVEASLLDLKTNGALQILELQKQQRVFTATLPIRKGILPEIVPGSRLRITGVCNDEIPVSGGPGEKVAGTQSLSSLNILLRDPRDVTLLSGPPWWTWKRTAALVGLLLAILAVALLWVHLLQRRLEHQQLARLVFSQQVFGKLEEERRRIAVNLHDSLGQTLLVIKNHSILATQSAGQLPGIENRLSEISTATSQAIEEVRRITHGLRPYHLDRLGLTQAIRASINQSDDHASILFASRVEDIDGLFDKETEIHIYRIVQESITNIFKHSAATEATVVIKRKPTTVLISIRDNGKGFNPSKLSAQSHTLGFGLTGIGERVRILKGTIVIDSKPQGGTSLTVEVPFKAA